MNELKLWMLGRGENTVRQDMIWNMAGSFSYAFASMVLSFLVMAIVGKEEGGVFAFAFSTFGQQMFLVAYFGIRPYHITDGSNEYHFGDYLRHRKVTCILAVVLGGLYLVVTGYTREKALVIFLMVIYKVLDGLCDVYESEFQRSGRLYLTGKSNTFRTVLSVTSFLIALVMTKHLVFSCMILVMAQVVGLFLLNVFVIPELSNVDFSVRKGSFRELFQSTGLLFLSVFLDFYIFSSAKYAIDTHLNDTASGYFNVIFMPTSVINLAAGFVVRPFLTSLTTFFNEKRWGEFRRLLGTLYLVILGCLMVAVFLCIGIGRPVLVLMERILGAQYENTLSNYHFPFVLIVLGGGFYAVMNLMYYALVIMRKQKQIFVMYGVIAVVAAAIAPYMVIRHGMLGASISYVLLMVILAVLFTLVTVFAYWRGKKQDEE